MSRPRYVCEARKTAAVEWDDPQTGIEELSMCESTTSCVGHIAFPLKQIDDFSNKSVCMQVMIKVTNFDLFHAA